MKLLKLYSSLPTFKTIEFNPTGFSIIFGEKLNSNNEKKTYNGTGKTLSLSLIDFCLGSNKREDLKQLNCFFILDFEHLKIKHTIKRHTNNDEIWIDNEKFTKLKKFKEKLNEILSFDEKEFITLRTKLSQVLRYRTKAYSDPLAFDEGMEYKHILNVLDSLNFDLDLMYEKIKNNNEYNVTTKVISELKKKEIKEVLANTNKDVNVERRKLQTAIETKENDLKKFKVAENLSEMREELVEKRIKVNELQNRLFIMKRQREKINQSIENNIFYSEQKVIETYNVYKELFKNDIVKEIDDVLSFHNQLLNKRNSRLSNQLASIEKNIFETEQICESLNSRIDEIYKAINGSIDLTELTALSSEINQLKLQLEKLDSYVNVLKTQDNKKLILDNKFSSQNIEAQQYLDSVEKIIDDVCSTFNEYTFEMYGNEIDSYIRLKNNLGVNSSRYNLEIKVPKDSSDGIKNSKIWAYDVTMKKRGKAVFDFLAHDNKIFYGWDYSVAVKALKKLYSENINYQYIFTINQSEYDGFKKEFNNDELFEQIINSNIKVRLTNNDKLLGMDVDLSKQ